MFSVKSTEPTYYNTFVNPMQPAPAPQPVGQTVSGQMPLQGSGPSNIMAGDNPQTGWGSNFGGYGGQQSDWYRPQQQNQQYMDQGAGKYGYGSGQNPQSAQRNLQNRQQLDQATMQALNQGLTGASAIDAINKAMGYDTGAVWDTVRGNIDVGTGGPNGVQYDRSAGGQYGAHDYNDAYNPQMSQGGGMQGNMPSWGNQPTNDPMAWRRMHAMRMQQRPQYGYNQYGNPAYQATDQGGFGGAAQITGNYQPQSFGSSLAGSGPLNGFNGSYGNMPGMSPRALGNAQY